MYYSLGTTFVVNTDTVNDQTGVAVATLADGGFAIGWQEEYGGACRSASKGPGTAAIGDGGAGGQAVDEHGNGAVRRVTFDAAASHDPNPSDQITSYRATTPCCPLTTARP